MKLKVLVSQSCPTLCKPMDGRPPGSSVHGILQARILEWVAVISIISKIKDLLKMHSSLSYAQQNEKLNYLFHKTYFQIPSFIFNILSHFITLSHIYTYNLLYVSVIYVYSLLETFKSSMLQLYCFLP